jgi:phage repressor protein C with HTH and peptisase S24 domain
VPKLAVGASAGAGALTEAEGFAGKVGFDEKWLRKLGVDPAQVSLIRVEGDSMQPTLNDGDDIMVDTSAASRPLKDGVHVLRMDDVLMVKRLVKERGGKLSVLSDNSAYPSWSNLDEGAVRVVGRVVWVGRRL